MQKSEINILVIEDDASQREALVEAIKRKGYRAVAVGKPDEAESLVKVKPIHCAIIDCMLPKANGVDLAVKLKKNLIESAGLIFISGIYRDKSFAQEAVKKTDALDFLHKPFDIEQLLEIVDKSLAPFIDKPKVDLHALLAAPSASPRERKKALDHVEEMYGYDLPFVLCILMDAKSSGHLNIVDEQQNIYGITLAKGAISKVDSEKTALMTKKILIQHGFITEMDLSEVQEKIKSGDLIKNLIAEGLMSPHVVDLIKKEQIQEELNKLLDSRKLKINFVPDRHLDEDPSAISIDNYLFQLHDQVKMIPTEYLKKFYSTWVGHDIYLGPQHEEQVSVISLPLVQQNKELLEYFKKGIPLEDILTQSSLKEDDFYHALHLLAIRRYIVFSETKRVNNIDEHINRIKMMHKELHGKNPIQIFEYFGLGDDPRAVDVSRIYKEFAKSNHPDTLPQSISEEHRKINHELFAWVTTAHDILSDEDKKKSFLDSLKQKEAEKQLRAEELILESRNLMNRAQFKEALAKASEAQMLFKSEITELCYIWAKVKAPGQLSLEAIGQLFSVLEKMPSETKKTALYIFVEGLLFNLQNKKTDAFNNFNKVFKMDPNFTEARREAIAIKAELPKKLSLEEIFTGDLSSVINNLLKKKSS